MVERTKKTSPGGAADLPDALSGRALTDYKTLRFQALRLDTKATY
jgi:hypothetical protein